MSFTEIWLARASVVCNYGRPSVKECEYHAYVCLYNHSNGWGRGGTWMQLNQKQYIIKGMVCGTGLHLMCYNDLFAKPTDHWLLLNIIG